MGCDEQAFRTALLRTPAAVLRDGFPRAGCRTAHGLPAPREDGGLRGEGGYSAGRTGAHVDARARRGREPPAAMPKILAAAHGGNSAARPAAGARSHMGGHHGPQVRRQRDASERRTALVSVRPHVHRVLRCGVHPQGIRLEVGCSRRTRRPASWDGRAWNRSSTTCTTSSPAPRSASWPTTTSGCARSRIPPGDFRRPCSGRLARRCRESGSSGHADAAILIRACYSARDANVSQASTLPWSRPRRNHCWRCAAEPCVKLSGTT